MKTVIFDNIPSPGCRNAWRFLSDSAHTNAGKPFFIPDFAEEFDAFLAPVVKLSRLGKSIGKKFAHRYYGQIAPALHFKASSLMRSLIEDGLPADMACNFDRSLIVGDFSVISESFAFPRFSLRKNGQDVTSIDFSECIGSLDLAISLVSESNTMKTGDFIIPVLSGPIPIAIGDSLEITADDNPVLLVAIK